MVDYFIKICVQQVPRDTHADRRLLSLSKLFQGFYESVLLSSKLKILEEKMSAMTKNIQELNFEINVKNAKLLQLMIDRR